MTAQTYVRRRNLLLGLGHGALFLSPLARAVKARAAGKPGASNFLVYFTPNGHVRGDFGSDGNDGSFKLRRGMEKANGMADYISTVRGLSNKSQHPNRPFHDQISRLLTVKSNVVVNAASGPSVDQAIAELAGKSPLNLKVYWSRYGEVGTYQNLSWKKASFPNRSENDPRKAYTATFGGFMPSQGENDNAELKAALAQQKSVLDFLREDINLFKGRLPNAEKSRLDIHLDALRQFETKLNDADPGTGGGGLPGPSAMCPMDKAMKASTSAPPNDSGVYNIPAFVEHGNVQISLMVAAMACGVRNAGTIIMQGGAGALNPNGGAGKADDHHSVSHNDAPREVWVQIDNWYAGRYAALLKEMQDVGILDDTVVMWASEISEDHNHNNGVFVVGGGKNLGFKYRKTAVFPFQGGEGGGRNAARNPANRSLSDLWTTAFRACGGQGVFGEDVGGPISEIWSG